MVLVVSHDLSQEFVKAVIAYQRKVNGSANPKDGPKLDEVMEKNRKIIVRSFSLAKHMYVSGHDKPPSKEQDLEAGAEFLEVIIQ